MKNCFLLIFFLSVSLSPINGQCYPDRHNTNWFDAWISCETAPNPNDSYGASHWILYDLKHPYNLGSTHFWNNNDPSHLDYGMQELSIDYSIDGNHWINLGEYNFEMATGTSVYEGFDGPDFSGVSARYLLITGLSNYGGECFGFSEIRIDLLNSPVSTKEILLEMNCNANEKAMYLEWQAMGKSDGIEYYIEKSEDTQNWYRLEESRIKLYKEGTYTFHYSDTSNSGQSAYYRLIAISKNGKFQYSGNHFCSGNKLEARIYPNPMTESGKLEIQCKGTEDIFFSISDVYGRMIHQKAFTPNSIINSIELGQIITEKGQYSITIRQGNQMVALKLFKMD